MAFDVEVIVEGTVDGMLGSWTCSVEKRVETPSRSHSRESLMEFALIGGMSANTSVQ